MSNTGPIGIFDSGIGGLTVVAALRRQLPEEALLYLGDTARVPYGSKSPEVVRRYALRCSHFLVEQGAKMLVVACNTASAHALEAMQHEFGLPVVGVITPGAELAARRSRSGRIGVIGTEGTIQSGSYQAAIKSHLPRAQVLAQPCPLFVPLAEEGLVDHVVTRIMAEEYLKPLLLAEVDTLVLGCTHYPLLRTVIQSIMARDCEVIDSATTVASVVGDVLTDKRLLCDKKPGRDRFFATDTAARFQRVGRAFLGDGIDDVQVVDL
jgi:glutamate racemase